PGELIPKLEVKRDMPWLDPDSQQARDIERFTWFSQGFVSVDPHNPYRIFDARYSLLPNVSQGLWGITVSPDAPFYEHVRYVTDRDLTGDKRRDFFRMLKNEY
ncbi:MAG: metal-dependent hydrolase, partial [Pseudomonadota bacterium]